MSAAEDSWTPETEGDGQCLEMAERVRNEPELKNLVSALTEFAKRMEGTGIPAWIVGQVVDFELRASPLGEMARKSP